MTVPALKLAMAIAPCRRVSSYFFLADMADGELVLADKEGKDERRVAGTFETSHPLFAGKHSVLDVGCRKAGHGRVVLVGTADEGKICIHIRRKIAHLRFPRQIPVCVGATGELHVQEYPVIEDDTECLGAPVEIFGLLSHFDAGAASLDRGGTVSQCGVERLDEDGMLLLVVEVGQLLDAESVLVFDPGLHDRTAVIVPSVRGINPRILEGQDDTGDGTPFNREVRDVDFQYVRCLVRRIARIIGNLGIEDHVMLLLMGLEIDLSSPEIIAG